MKKLKVLFRSRDRAFTRAYFDAANSRHSGAEASDSVLWKQGDGRPFFFRPGSSDLGLIYDIAFKAGEKGEYWLPDYVAPEVILDIGANIGVTARYLAHRFPKARVICFEPVPENFAILQKNIAGIPRISAHNFGLGSEDLELDLVIPTGSDYNKGGFSLHSAATDGPKARVLIRNATTALNELGIHKVDVIKIDTEGAEYDILTALPAPLLRDTRWIYGEVHSEGLTENTSFKVLHFLSQTHLISVKKGIGKKNFSFDAAHPTLAAQTRRFRPR